MSRFRNPGQREAAWGRHYAKRGLTARDALADERPAYPSERLERWRTRYYRTPIEQRVGVRHD